MTEAVVTLYVTGWCGFCQRAKNLLSKKNVRFHEIDVEEDPKFREEMIARSNARTVPQIFIGERHVGGCDALFELDRNGELDRLLQGV